MSTDLFVDDSAARRVGKTNRSAKGRGRPGLDHSATTSDLGNRSLRRPRPNHARNRIHRISLQCSSSVSTVTVDSSLRDGEIRRVLVHPDENRTRFAGSRFRFHCGWCYQPTFFCTSTLFPITAPRIPPTPAPINPPFTLSRLVVAPMIAPAAAPIAASRPVCLTVVVGAGAG